MNARFKLQPDLAAIEDFLSDHVGSAIHVVSILPDTADEDPDKIHGRYFGDAAYDAVIWVAGENAQGRSCYWTVNITKEGLSKKPGKADFVAARFSHADVDPPKGAAAMDKSSALASLLSLDAAPSLVINSGNGLQPLWRLAYAPQNWAEIEDINYSIEKKLGADHCHNIDRLLRIPGTVNWPDAGKRARGRVPVMASLAYVGDENAIYTPEELAKAFPKVARPHKSGTASGADIGDIKLLTPDDLGISGISPIRPLIEQPSGPDRSKDGIRAAGALFEAGYSREQILGILLNPANKVSAHYLAQRNPKRAALRAFAFVARPSPANEDPAPGEGGAEKPSFRWEDADAVNGEQSAEADQDARRDQLKKAAIAALKKMNGQFFVVREKSRVLAGFFEKYQERKAVVTMPFHEFRNLWGHCYLTIDSNPKSPELKEKTVSLPDWWLRHSGRRQYDGLTLDPTAKDADGNITAVVRGRLNIWRGFGVKSLKGDCSLFINHLRFVAGGDEGRFQYILYWLAWTVQNPARRAEVALVFRGAKGCGKGSIGNTLKILFGCHGLQISSADQISGRFNAHLRGLMLLFADEAYWPGDKAAEGNFKRLISEPELAIEEKGRDVIAWPNMLHMIMASNEDWVVPATEGERRYFVVDVPGDHAREQKYFDPLYKQLEKGGYEALLHDLLALDIGDFHPRKIPADKNALLSQQAASLQPLDAWWAELLETGEIPGSPDGSGQAISGDYDDEGISYSRTRPGLLTSLRKSVPRTAYLTDHAIGKYLSDQGCKRKRVKRQRGWLFPPLKECREKWNERFPSWEWREPLEEWGKD